MKVKVSNNLIGCHSLPILLTVMEVAMTFESVYNVLLPRRLEIIKWFLVKVDTVPEILTGLRVGGVMPDQVVLDIKSKILDDVTGEKFAAATLDWMLNFLTSSESTVNKVFVSKMLTSYVTIAKFQMRLHTTYQTRGVDYSILQLL